MINGDNIPTLKTFILSFLIIKCLEIKINRRYFEISIGCIEKPAIFIHLDAPPAVFDKPGIKIKKRIRKPKK